MDSKITGFRPPTATLTTDKASRTRETSSAGAAAQTPAAESGSSPVHITGAARRLAALEQAVHSAPVIDEARVAAVREALENGSYEISPQRIAAALLRMDQELNSAEK